MVAPQFNGHAREEYPNGDCYEGEFKKGQRHGSGTYYGFDGRRYEGDFREGAMEGKGSYYYANNEHYQGEWRDSQRNGRGKFTYADGSSYDGLWSGDLRHGKGLMRFADGGSYTGAWVADRRHGQGQMTYADYGKYDGAWADDVRHGQGTLQLPNGSIYDGQFVEGIPCGTGNMWNADEHSTYNGDFAEGLRHGDGVCEYKKANERFEGKWKAGARLEGVMFLADGEVERVGFLNDVIVRREKLSMAEQAKYASDLSVAQSQRSQQLSVEHPSLEAPIDEDRGPAKLYAGPSFDMQENSAAERAAEAESEAYARGPPEAVKA